MLGSIYCIREWEFCRMGEFVWKVGETQQIGIRKCLDAHPKDSEHHFVAIAGRNPLRITWGFSRALPGLRNPRGPPKGAAAPPAAPELGVPHLAPWVRTRHTPTPL